MNADWKSKVKAAFTAAIRAADDTRNAAVYAANVTRDVAYDEAYAAYNAAITAHNEATA